MSEFPKNQADSEARIGFIEDVYNSVLETLAADWQDIDRATLSASKVIVMKETLAKLQLGRDTFKRSHLAVALSKNDDLAITLEFTLLRLGTLISDDKYHRRLQQLSNNTPLPQPNDLNQDPPSLPSDSPFQDDDPMEPEDPVEEPSFLELITDQVECLMELLPTLEQSFNHVEHLRY